MTDIDTIREILTRSGIVFSEHTQEIYSPYEVGTLIEVSFDSNYWKRDVQPGYPGFYTKFTFDSNGALIQIGAWE